MRLHILPVTTLALALVACNAVPTPSPTQPSSPLAESSVSVPTASHSTVVEASREPARPSPTAKPPANPRPGKWVGVKGDADAEMPVAVAAGSSHVVVLDVAPACYFPEDPVEMAPVPEPPLAWVFTSADKRFRQGSELDTVRTGFAAASLPDSRVLVAGGFNDAWVPKSSTRIWNAETGEWSEGPLMTIARARPVAVTLRDGRVLVIGGETPSQGTTAKTETYDPATNRWTRTGSLPLDNPVISAVTLATGDVLAVAVTELDGAPVVISLYRPAEGRWQSVEHPPRPVGRPVAMPDGSALFFGGDRRVLRYDAGDGWSEAGTLLAPRAGAAIAPLEDGRVLLAGGYAGDPAAGTAKAVKTAELFDPTTGKSAKAASLPRPRLDAAALQLDDGSVLVAGGVEDAYNGDTPWCPTVADSALRWVP